MMHGILLDGYWCKTVVWELKARVGRCTGWQNIDTLNEFTFLGSLTRRIYLLHVRLSLFSLKRRLGICSFDLYM